MVYQCFLDDSKDKHQQRLMVSAGFIGTENEWSSLSSAWRRVLKSHGMDYFKSSEYYSLTGQFERFRSDAYPKPTGRKAAEAIRTELQEVFKSHRGIIAMGTSIPLEAYYGVLQRAEAQGTLPADPYQAALVSVMYETAKLVKSTRGHHVVAFMYDDDDPSSFAELYSAYKKFRAVNPKIFKTIVGFSPWDDKNWPPLQAADMIANYTLQLGLKGLDSCDMRADPKEMRQNIKMLGYWSERYILSVLKRNLIRKGRPIPLDLASDEYG